MASGPAPETYSRPVAAGEWWTLGHPRGLVCEVQLCVEGDGVIDPAALAAAVATASQACPGARLIRRGYQWVDSGQAPPVRVTEAADFDRNRLDSPLLRTPLGCEGRPTCEVVLVQGEPSTVIFRTSHSVMDGHGAMLWQRQVFRTLRGETVEGAVSRLSFEEARAEIAARLGIDLPPAAAPSGSEWRSALGKMPSGPRRSIWRRRTIDGIHLGVTAKVAQQIAAHGGGEGVVNIPVDLRQYLPGLRTTVGLTATAKIHVHEDDDWTDVDASLLTELSQHQFLTNRSDQTVLGMPVTFVRELRRYWDKQARANHHFIGAKRLEDAIGAVSHLGTVDLADFCADGFEATSYYSLGTVLYAPELNITESPGRTEVTVAWRDGPGVAGRIEALLDRIEEHLSPQANRVWEGNRPDRPVPPAPIATLTSLFVGQVRRTPDAVAITGADGDMTYAELGQRSAAVAAALAARGIGRGDRVGLVAGRSPATIVAVWGILRAGAAHLPIDASYPDARIAQILTAAAVPVCLLESPAGQRDCLPSGCEGVSLDSLPGSAPARWRDVDGQPDDLACIIYTSGSTGAPKGVEIEHRNVVNYVRWATREAGIGARTKMPLIAPISFDMAGCAIFLPLLAGGIVLPVREVNAITLREVIEDGGVTAMAITPSHLDLINQAGIRRSTVRVVMTAGELLRRSTAARAKEMFGPECRILCQWGPTETTIVNTSHEFDPEVDTDAGVPFGRPMDNNTVYLLDSQGRFVAPGEPGEAYVGGAQVGRGYLGRSDLTRQRFIHLADGTRVYRTGDIARLLPSGELTFIGRADDQVKVAGHRVEPAEIAQALEDHPDILQAAMAARSRPGRHDKELCAYVVTASGTAPVRLKEFLAGRLPGYMIPVAIIAVPEIPRTPNGKTDARQLPDPFTGTCGDDAPRPDRDDVTNAIAGIWARTLRVDAHLIDERTDFRELGGNSILMLSMIEEVSRTVAADTRAHFMAELAQIIREPTLRTISHIARQARIRHLDQLGSEPIGSSG